MTIQYLMMANFQMYRKLLMRRLAGTGLTSGQPRVLDYLGDHDGVSQRDIALACHLEEATLSSLLNGMEKKGLVERRRMGGNRRSYYIFLTPRGREMCRIVAAAFQDLEREVFPPAGSPEYRAWAGALEAIHRSLAARKEAAEDEPQA